MTLVVHPGRASGTVAVPASKSYTHRAFTLALLAHGESRIERPLLSADPLATLRGIELLGARVAREADAVQVRGGEVATPENVIDCGNSGTTLRLLTGVSALAPETTVLTGDGSLRKRPMQPLLDALEPLGVRAESTRGNGCPPVLVRGPLRGGVTDIRGDVSSQYVSALVLAATGAPEDTRIALTTPLTSRPYVDITLEVLEAFGGTATVTDDGFDVPGDQNLRGATYRVPGDYSTAAFPLAAAAVTCGEVTVTNLPTSGAQGDRAILDALEAFGCTVREGDGSATVKCEEPLRGIEMDLADTPDMFPALCAVAVHARGESRFTGAPNLRVKESDRIHAMVQGLRRLGADAEELPDGAVIRGGSQLRGARLETHHDHRILMALSVAALAADGPSTFEEHESAAVSYPTFVEDFRRLGIRAEVTDA